MEGRPLSVEDPEEARRKKELEEQAEAGAAAADKPQNIGFFAIESKPKEDKPSALEAAWANTDRPAAEEEPAAETESEPQPEAEPQPAAEEDPEPKPEAPTPGPPVLPEQPAAEAPVEEPPAPPAAEQTAEESAAVEPETPPAPPAEIAPIEAEPEPEPQTEAEPQPVAKEDPEPKPEVNPEPQPESPAAVEEEPAPEPETPPEPPAEVAPVEAEPEPEPDVQAETEPAGPEPEAEPEVEEEPEVPVETGHEGELNIEHPEESAAEAENENQPESPAATEEEPAYAPEPATEAEAEDGPEQASAEAAEATETVEEDDVREDEAEQPKPSVMASGGEAPAPAVTAPELNRSSRAAEAKMDVESAPKGPSTDQRLETLTRDQLLEMAEKVSIDGKSLRHAYEARVIGEKGLRRLLEEYERGGDMREALKREILEHQIDFERDPAMRDLAVASGKSGVAEGDNAEKQLMDKIMTAGAVAIDSADNEKDGAAAEEAGHAPYDHDYHPKNYHRRRKAFVDAALVSVISVLALLVVFVYVSRR